MKIERAVDSKNAYTDIDITNYHNKVLRVTGVALDMNKELATKPLLGSKIVDRERDVIIEEMKRTKTSRRAKVARPSTKCSTPGTKWV